MINFFRENSSVDITSIMKLCDLHSLNLQKFLQYFIINKIIDLNEKDNTIKFRYVGLIIQKDLVIFILPKYFKNLDSREKNIGHAHLLLKVFDKYITNYKLYNYELRAFNSNEEFLGDNIYGLYKFFLNDYIENGLYSDYKKKYEVNGPGSIEWGKTISENSVIISNGSPIYTRLYTYTNCANEDNIIKRIHICILKKVSEFFEKLGMFGLDIDFEEADEIDFNEYEYFGKVLANRLNIEFIDRNKNLIKAMKMFMERDVFNAEDNEINFFGTREFEYVWQKVCEEVFKNDFGKSIKKLDKPIMYGLNENGEIANNIKGELAPDIVRYIKNKKTIYILDAKYYDFHFDNLGKVKGEAPKTYDVVKQFAYESKLVEKYKPRVIFNAFLIPTMKSTSKEGYIEYNLFTRNRIDIVYINVLQLFEKYLKSEEIEISDIFISN